MTDLRKAAKEALEALNSIDVGYRSPSGNPLELSFDEGKCEAAITALRAALAQQAEPQDAELSAALGWPGGISEPVLDRKVLLQKVAALMQDKLWEDHRVSHLWGHMLAQQAEPTVKESLQVPPEVAATLTTSDIAWLETRRLTKLWRELGQMRWAGADEGWDRAIEAVRIRLNDECQAVLHWKATADQSQATAVELLRKMQGVKDG